MKISVIIPTMNRPESLKRTLDSLMRQTRLPDEIVVVDQSTNNQSKIAVSETKLGHVEKPVSFKYVVQEEKSLVRARNRGLEAAEGDILSFLDDDVELFGDYLEKVGRRFEEDPALAGLSGNVLIAAVPVGFKWRLRKSLMRIFCLSGFDGRLTVSGFGYPIYEREIDRPLEVELLVGCNMHYRRALIGDERFDEWFTGYGFREDVDFSYRISRRGRLLMVPEARLYHLYSPGNRLDVCALKKMEIVNYYYLFRKFKNGGFFSSLLFGYSLVGLALIDFLEWASTLNPAKFGKWSAGMRSSLGLMLGKVSR